MYRYAGPFAFLAAIPLLYQISETMPVLVPLMVLIALLVTHYIESEAPMRPAPALRSLPIVYIPLQLAVTIWALRMAAQPSASLAAFMNLAIAIGVCTGVFGVLAAHEMVHSRMRWHRNLGSALLTSMSYRHFRIAHVHGHHRYAATHRDASTARLGESFYAFLARTLPAQWREAWRFEQQRCRNKFLPFLRNGLVYDIVVMATMYTGLLFVGGWRAGAFLVGESAVAVLVLEAFNYVAHYGLVRRTRDGRLEPMGDHHSWNSAGMGNLLIFNMGCHSHHHRAPSISYEGLKSAGQVPTLPGGYAGAILLALIPPLWRTIMDQRALAAGEEGKFSYASDGRPATAYP